MSEDTKQPEKTEAPESEASAPRSAETPAPEEIPPAGVLAGADEEKAAMVEQAKSRVAALKESLATEAPGAPKPPVKKKEAGPQPTDASTHPLVQKLSSRFDKAVSEAVEFIGQVSVSIERNRIVEVCEALRTDDKTPFNYLSDLTCVHFPDRETAPFEMVYHLYSIPANERLRLRVKLALAEGIDSVTGVWPAADWMEREVFDLFGIVFHNHPDLRRLLLPPDWEGHPLRKDVALEFVENQWTEKHLPEMTDVQREQVEQRRGYGLELLSVPQERQMREIFRGSKEVMPKDK